MISWTTACDFAFDYIGFAERSLVEDILDVKTCKEKVLGNCLAEEPKDFLLHKATFWEGWPNRK